MKRVIALLALFFVGAALSCGALAQSTVTTTAAANPAVAGPSMITGGTIDNTVIGGTTPAATTGTTVSATTGHRAPDGSATVAGYGFTSAVDAGFYMLSGVPSFTRGGVRRLAYDSTTFFLIQDASVLAFGAAGDVKLQRHAANTLALRNGALANLLHINRAHTDGSNYERQAFQSGAGYFEWAAETAGTGTDNISLRLTPAGLGHVRLGGPVVLVNAAEPTCDSTTRGTLVMVQGGASVADTVRICTKDGADAYAYRALF